MKRMDILVSAGLVALLLFLGFRFLFPSPESQQLPQRALLLNDVCDPRQNMCATGLECVAPVGCGAGGSCIRLYTCQVKEELRAGMAPKEFVSTSTSSTSSSILSSTLRLSPSVRIDYVEHSPRGDDFLGEWFSVVNRGGEDADLSGWFIWDEGPERYRGNLTFPEGAVIPAGASIVVAQSADDFHRIVHRDPDYEIQGTSPRVPDIIRVSGSLNLGKRDDTLYLSDGFEVVDAYYW